MTKPKKRILRVIRKSCLTGRAVWIGHKRSYVGEWKAYKRAARREMERIRRWGDAMARRKANIQRLLSGCMANGELNSEKCDAARQLKKLSEREEAPDREFYDHIQKEQALREQAKNERRKRHAKISENTNYDK